MKLKKVIIFLLIFYFTNIFFLKANFNFIISLTDKGPIISRFKSITFYITNSNQIIIDTVKLYCNNIEYKNFVMQNSVKDNILLISFKPFIPLKYGFNKINLVFSSKNGKIISKELIFLVNPEANPILAPYIINLKQNPKNPQFHYLLGQGYEKINLLEDAQSEYLTAYKLAPNFIAAKMAYERIFALWGTKQIKKDNIVIKVSIDSNFKNISNILIFTITIYNKEDKDLKIYTDKIILKDDLNNVFLPVNDYKSKLQEKVDSGYLSYDNYIKTSYFLQKYNFKIYKEIKIPSQTNKTFYLIYFIHDKNSSNFELIINLNKEKFKFPFII